MVDPTSTSRLEWRKWDIFTKIPLGTVAFTGEDDLVARAATDEDASKLRFADLNPRRGLSGDVALYSSDTAAPKSVTYLTEGAEILVEVGYVH